MVLPSGPTKYPQVLTNLGPPCAHLLCCGGRVAHADLGAAAKRQLWVLLQESEAGRVWSDVVIVGRLQQPGNQPASSCLCSESNLLCQMPDCGSGKLLLLLNPSQPAKLIAVLAQTYRRVQL